MFTKLPCSPLSQLFKLYSNTRYKPTIDVHRNQLENINMLYLLQKTFLDLLWPHSNHSSVCFMFLLCLLI